MIPKAIASDNSANCLYLTGNLGVSRIQNTNWTTTLSGPKYTGETTSKPGFKSEIGVGCKAAENVRFELTYIKNSGEVDKLAATNSSNIATVSSGEFSTKSFMAGVFIDFLSEKSKFTPYIGAGIGSTNVAIDKWTIAEVHTGSSDTTVLGYQFKIGSSYDLGDQTDLYLEASYQGTPNINIRGLDIDNVTSLNGTFGARFHF